MKLDLESAQKFLLTEFGLKVDKNDPILANLMLGQLTVDMAKPVMEKLANDLVEKTVEPLKKTLMAVYETVLSCQAMTADAKKMRQEMEVLRASVDALNRQLADFKIRENKRFFKF